MRFFKIGTGVALGSLAGGTTIGLIGAATCTLSAVVGAEILKADGYEEIDVLGVARFSAAGGIMFAVLGAILGGIAGGNKASENPEKNAGCCFEGCLRSRSHPVAIISTVLCYYFVLSVAMFVGNYICENLSAPPSIQSGERGDILLSQFVGAAVTAPLCIVYALALLYLGHVAVYGQNKVATQYRI